MVGGRDGTAGAARRDLRARATSTERGEAEAAIRASVEYAFAHPEASREYVRANSQEMSDEVCDQHIALYVNEFTVDLGDEGFAAIDRLLHLAWSPQPPKFSETAKTSSFSPGTSGR